MASTTTATAIGDDFAACPGATQCVEGQCVTPCQGGEFACPNGFECVDGFCFASDCDDVECELGEVCMNGVCVGERRRWSDDRRQWRGRGRRTGCKWRLRARRQRRRRNQPGRRRSGDRRWRELRARHRRRRLLLCLRAQRREPRLARAARPRRAVPPIAIAAPQPGATMSRRARRRAALAARARRSRLRRPRRTASTAARTRAAGGASGERCQRRRWQRRRLLAPDPSRAAAMAAVDDCGDTLIEPGQLRQLRQPVRAGRRDPGVRRRRVPDPGVPRGPVRHRHGAGERLRVRLPDHRSHRRAVRRPRQRLRQR